MKCNRVGLLGITFRRAGTAGKVEQNLSEMLASQTVRRLFTKRCSMHLVVTQRKASNLISTIFPF